MRELEISVMLSLASSEGCGGENAVLEKRDNGERREASQYAVYT